MIRLNAALATMLVLCALALVTARHQARNAYVELQKEQDLARQLEIEFGQLQLEQSTWAMHARVEKIAAGNLRMRVPDTGRVRRIPPPAASSGP